MEERRQGKRRRNGSGAAEAPDATMMRKGSNDAGTVMRMMNDEEGDGNACVNV